MRKSILVAVLSIALMLTASTAFAFSLAGGYLGPVYFKFDNWEIIHQDASADSGDTIGTSPDTVYMGDNYGIFKVTSIQDNIGNSLWADFGSPEQLTGVFYGFDVYQITGPASGPWDIDSLGGQLDMYSQLKSDGGYTAFSPDPDNDGNPSDNWIVGVDGLPKFDTVTDGNLFLSSLAKWGVRGDIGDTTTTLHGVFTVAAPPSGDGTAYWDVIPGSGDYGWMFDSDCLTVTEEDPTTTPPTVLQTATRDMYSGSRFPSVGKPTLGWTTTSFDPVEACAVPEPATMLLLGTGLIGLAGVGRKKKFFKKG